MTLELLNGLPLIALGSDWQPTGNGVPSANQNVDPEPPAAQPSPEQAAPSTAPEPPPTEASSDPVDFSFDDPSKIYAADAYTLDSGLSIPPSPFVEEKSDLPIWIATFPTHLDFEADLPEAEADSLLAKSFAPVPPAPSKPRFRLYPKRPILPKPPEPPKPPSKPPESQPAAAEVKPLSPTAASLTPQDMMAAQTAWKFIQRSWNPSTGMVNAVEDYPWTTLWDQGSAILGIHAAQQLKIISAAELNRYIAPLLKTLKTLPLAPTGLPNKAYSTRTALMRSLDNGPDPKGLSGWSVLDTSRLLVSLVVLKTQHPQYRTQIDQIVKRWKTSKLVKNGWLQGGTLDGRQIVSVQEGRMGYEQYAAEGLKRWKIVAINALSKPPVKTVTVEGVPLQVDLRNLKNSGASNPLTSDPYVMWGELGWSKQAQQQSTNLLAAQQKRHQRTKILTAVNEDSLDRAPFFLYSSVYADGKPWDIKNSSGQNLNHLQQLSVKAAFGWEALFPKVVYAQTLRKAVQPLSDLNRGYFTGQFINQKLGVNTVINVNTNAVILESILFKARNGKPLILP